MNELLQKCGSSAVFQLPEGISELMSDITREVLREQPTRIYDFTAKYLSVLLATREHGKLAINIVKDLCDCKASVYEHLIQLQLPSETAKKLADIIKKEVESFEVTSDKVKLREWDIVKKILESVDLDEIMTAKVANIIRNAFRDYWYRKKLLEESLKEEPGEPWKKAAQRTLELYMKTKPSISEMARATEKIQAAYRGYHTRSNLLNKQKPTQPGIKVNLPGAPLDIAESREIELGPVIDVKVEKDDVDKLFAEQEGEPFKTEIFKAITHEPVALYYEVEAANAMMKSKQHDQLMDKQHCSAFSRSNLEISRSFRTPPASPCLMSPSRSHHDADDELPTSNTHKINFAPLERPHKASVFIPQEDAHGLPTIFKD